MKTLLLLSTLLLIACASVPLSPEETVIKSLIASQKGDAETRWELSSNAAQQELLNSKSKKEVLNTFKKETFMYELIKSWKTELISQNEDKARVKLSYKFLDPHSNKTLNETSDVILVKENGHWKISDD